MNSPCEYEVRFEHYHHLSNNQIGNPYKSNGGKESNISVQIHRKEKVIREYFYHSIKA